MQDEGGATIFGTDLDRDRCDEIMFGYVLTRMRVSALPSFSNYKKFEAITGVETELFRVKWFDYRFLHPVQATYLYAHFYVETYRTAFKRHVSRDQAEHVKVLKKPDLFANDKRLVGALWRGRQIADALGAPYPFFLEAAIRNMLRYWRQKYLPRPEHLYTDRVLDAVQQEWADAKRHRLFYADHHLYRAQHFVGTRDQAEHRDFLLEIAHLRRDPAPVLTGFVDKELLTIDWIAAKSGQDLADRVADAA